MTSRAIFIGLGGSGGRTLDFIYKELELKLLESGWTEGMPIGWQFLKVDVPHEAETERSSDVAPRRLRDADVYFPLTRYGDRYPNYVRDLERLPELTAGWLPSIDAVPGDIWEGAGQMRAVGRVLVLDSIDRLKDRLEKVIIPTVDGPEAKAEIGKLNLQLGDTGRSDKVDVWVITSLVGGSGSGMHLDVSLLLRALAHVGLESHLSVAYASDVFDTLDDKMRQQNTPNSLAAVSEIISVGYGPNQISAAEEVVLQLAKAPAPGLKGGRGAIMTFIQGRSNGTMTLSSTEDVYRSTARGIVALHLDPEIRMNFRGHFFINTPPAKSPDELRSLKYLESNQKEYQPTSSFGFATVTHGRSLFASYGADRLARMALEKILEPDDATKKRESIDPTSFEAPATKFAKDCGLLERGEEQITLELEELCSFAADEQIDRFATYALNQVASAGVSASENLIASLRDIFESKVESARFEADSDTALEKGAKLWIARATQRLMEGTIRSIGTDGAAATIIYLKKLQEQLESEAQDLTGIVTGGVNASGAASRIVKPKSQPQAKSRGLAALFGRHASAVAAPGLPGPKDEIKKLVAKERSVWDKKWNTKRVELLRGFASSVIVPLYAQVADTTSQMKMLYRQDKVFSGTFDKLTTGTIQSVHEPAPNEIVLDEIRGESGFEKTFEGKVAECFAGTSGVGDGTYLSVSGNAVAEILGGYNKKSRFWPSDESLPELVTLKCERQWNTDNGLPAVFSFTLTFEDIIASARFWMSTRTIMQSYVNENLEEYLNIPGSEGVARRQKFITSMGIALEQAKPMIKLNRDSSLAFHATEIGFSTQVSRIPIDAEYTYDRQEVVNRLEAEKVMNPDKAFGSTGNTKAVNVTRFLGNFVNPAIMDSVMDPILNEWAGADDEFWKFRRSRPLPQFIALSPDVQLSMVQGWYTLRFLGVISDEHVDQFVLKADKAPLMVPTARGARRLPSRLLTPIREGRNKDTIALLMESYILALVELTAGNPEYLDAYRGLSLIGRGAGPVLHDAIESGSFSSFSSSVIPFMIDASPEARKAAILDNLTSRRDEIAAMSVPEGASPWDTVAFSPTWEMREILLQALDGLREMIIAEARSADSSSKHA